MARFSRPSKDPTGRLGHWLLDGSPPRDDEHILNELEKLQPAERLLAAAQLAFWADHQHPWSRSPSRMGEHPQLVLASLLFDDTLYRTRLHPNYGARWKVVCSPRAAYCLFVLVLSTLTDVAPTVSEVEEWLARPTSDRLAALRVLGPLAISLDHRWSIGAWEDDNPLLISFQSRNFAATGQARFSALAAFEMFVDPEPIASRLPDEGGKLFDVCKRAEEASRLSLLQVFAYSECVSRMLYDCGVPALLRPDDLGEVRESEFAQFLDLHSRTILKAGELARSDLETASGFSFESLYDRPILQIDARTFLPIRTKFVEDRGSPEGLFWFCRRSLDLGTASSEQERISFEEWRSYYGLLIEAYVGELVGRSAGEFALDRGDENHGYETGDRCCDYVISDELGACFLEVKALVPTKRDASAPASHNFEKYLASLAIGSGAHAGTKGLAQLEASVVRWNSLDSNPRAELAILMTGTRATLDRPHLDRAVDAWLRSCADRGYEPEVGSNVEVCLVDLVGLVALAVYSEVRRAPLVRLLRDWSAWCRDPVENPSQSLSVTDFLPQPLGPSGREVEMSEALSAQFR